MWGRSGEQQNVRRRPAEIPLWVVYRQSRERLGKAVTIRLAHIEVLLAIGSELVRLVEDDEVVGEGCAGGNGFAHPGKHAFARERVDADNQAITFGPDKGVADPGLRPTHDPEGESEEGAHLAL